MDDSLRDRIATSLGHLADQTTWNPEARRQVYDLVAANLQNDLLKNVYDDVIHDSGAFHSHRRLAKGSQFEKEVILLKKSGPIFLE